MRAWCVVASLALASVATGDTGWSVYDQKDGILYEQRSVVGSSFDEYRASVVVPKTPKETLGAIWAQVTDKTPRKQLHSTFIREQADEVVVYQQISVPAISDRDATFRIWKSPPSDDGTTEVHFEAANDLGPPPNPKFVRLTDVRGSWVVAPTPDGKTRLVYTSHSDPGGSVPAFVTRGAQKDHMVLDVTGILKRLGLR